MSLQGHHKSCIWHRIADWTVEDILCFTVHDKAASMAKIISYSGGFYALKIVLKVFNNYVYTIFS